MEEEYNKFYEKIVGSKPTIEYKGPEQQGNLIEKCTILKPLKEVEYSNHSKIEKVS